MGQEKLFDQDQQDVSSNDFYTPAWIFEAMGIDFDLDVASPPQGVPWIPTKRFYTQLDDGLTSPWTGNVWMNPPFKKVTPWVEKFIDHNQGIALLPLAKSKFTDLIMMHSDAMVVLPAYMRFTSPFYNLGMIRFVCALFALGDENVEAISKVGRMWQKVEK